MARFGVMFAPVAAQRVEGLMMLVAGIVAFSTTDFSWWWLVGLILVPDLSMIGYLANPSTGAIIYNIGHSLLGPGLLLGWHWLGGPVVALAAAGIWIAHIGADRLFGYGLKYGDDFAHTHLGMIGSRKGNGF
jgi:hypothetical protein